MNKEEIAKNYVEKYCRLFNDTCSIQQIKAVLPDSVVFEMNEYTPFGIETFYLFYQVTHKKLYNENFEEMLELEKDNFSQEEYKEKEKAFYQQLAQIS